MSEGVVVRDAVVFDTDQRPFRPYVPPQRRDKAKVQRMIQGGELFVSNHRSIGISGRGRLEANLPVCIRAKESKVEPGITGSFHVVPHVPRPIFVVRGDQKNLVREERA